MTAEKSGQKFDFLKSAARAESGQKKTEVLEIPKAAQGPVIKNYLSEARWISAALKKNPKRAQEILRVLSITKDNSLILGFAPVYKLHRAVEDLYKSVCDERVAVNDNIAALLEAVAQKLDDCCLLIERGDLKALEETEILPYLIYLDKAVAGEIFDAKKLFQKKEKRPDNEREILLQEAPKEDSPISVKSSEIGRLVNQHEEMIARAYILMNQVELLKNALAEGDVKAAKNLCKLLASDSQNFQSNLLISHDQLMSFIQDDSFLAKHQDFQGFFVLANGRKYLVPAEFVVDIVSESPLNYVEKQNQKFVSYAQENESGSEKSREDIPIYSLSSLLPGTPVRERPVLDTIILVDYQGQKLGIVVDALLKFVSLIKKPMPSAFENFPILKGVAFDEKYDMIPILYTPEIMKKFLAMRGYDVKKFEAATRKRIPRILVVDDSETTRLVERSIVESAGYSAEEAYDGIDAMEKIKDRQFDLIICDDDMPRMNGEIFVDNVRRMENYKNAPVIAISAKEIPGADVFMAKAEFKRDNLIQKIKEMLLARGEK